MMRILKYSLTLGIGFVFLWFTFRKMDVGALWNILQQVSWLPILFAGAITIVSHVARCLRWRLLISPLKFPIRLGATFAALMIGYAVNLVLPRGGEVARVVSLNKEEDIPMSGLLATVVVERVLDVVALALLLGITLMEFSEPLSRAFPGMEYVGMTMLIVCPLALVSLIVASRYREKVVTIFRRIISRVSQKLSDKLTILLETFLTGISSLHSAGQIGGVILWSVVTWGLYIVAMYLILVSFNLPATYDISLSGAILVLVMTSIGVTIPVPGAVGTYHYLCMQSLVLIFAVQADTAGAFAAISHALSFVVINGIGGTAIWGLQQFGLFKGSASLSKSDATP
jgi:glycosyltransferase 2 family protein